MAKAKHVTKAIEFLIGITGTYALNEDGYVIDTSKDKIVKVKSTSADSQGELRDLISFQEEIRDQNAVVLNPFSEGTGTTADQNWFYSTETISLAGKLYLTFVEIASWIVLDKQKDNDFELPTKVVKFIAPYAKDVDKTTLKELESIGKDFDRLIKIWYDRHTKEAQLRCALFSERKMSFKDNFPKVRKKTWNVLDNIMAKIFELDLDAQDDAILDDFRVKSDLISIPRVEAYLGVVKKVYEKLNPYLEMIDEVNLNTSYAIDMSTFNRHMKNLEDYYDASKFLVQPTMTSSTNVAPTPIGQQDASYAPCVSPVGGGYGGYAPPQPQQQNTFAPIQFNGDVSYGSGGNIPTGAELSDPYSGVNLASTPQFDVPQVPQQQQYQQPPQYMQHPQYQMHPQQQPMMYQQQPQQNMIAPVTCDYGVPPQYQQQQPIMQSMSTDPYNPYQQQPVYDPYMSTNPYQQQPMGYQNPYMQTDMYGTGQPNVFDGGGRAAAPPIF